LFASLEEKEREGLKKKKESVEKIEDIGRRGLGRLILLQYIKPSSFGELKNCIK